MKKSIEFISPGTPTCKGIRQRILRAFLGLPKNVQHASNTVLEQKLKQKVKKDDLHYICTYQTCR
jgi:hypothetical protein